MSSIGGRISRLHSRSRKVVSARNVSYARTHKCTELGCEKAYTRLEHLRRHQLNHKASKIWTCASCAAVFVRRDLWQRHLKISHDSEDPSAFESSETARSTEDSAEPDQNCLIQLASSTAGADDLTLLAPSGEVGSPEIVLPVEHPTEEFVADSRSPYGNSDVQAQPFDTGFSGSDGWSSFVPHEMPEMLDIEWFMQHQIFPDIEDDPAIINEAPIAHHISPIKEKCNALEPINSVTVTCVSPDAPVYLQEAQTKPLFGNGLHEAPNCGFRICNALTESRRFELLLALRNMAEIDFADRMFSSNSMKQGIHMYCRYFSPEYSIHHTEVLFPSSEESRAAIIEVFGEETPAECTWAVITIGWSLMRSESGQESRMALHVQRLLRKYVINHSAFTLSAPLWLVQTLFLVLLFARYQGTRSEYGFSCVFHGVLLDAVRRLNSRLEDPPSNMDRSRGISHIAWMQWVYNESVRRLTTHTFVFDVKNAILHGGDNTMTPFELHVTLPVSEYAWYAKSPQECAIALDKVSEPPSFLTTLKRFWNPSALSIPVSDLPRDQYAILYGIISIAREIVRHEDNTFSTKSKQTLSSLGNTVRQSLATWEVSLDQMKTWDGPVPVIRANCNCMIRLAPVLYEIGPVDLQTIAGSSIIEGKKRGAADYARSKRKLRAWIKQDRAILGVQGAARIIYERLHVPAQAPTHCHHCLWCLYLAGLVCWAFGFVSTGFSNNAEFIIDGRLVSENLAGKRCDEYLMAVMAIKDYATNAELEYIGETAGMLIVLIRYMELQTGSGLIDEGVELLTRLSGLAGQDL